MVHMNDTAYYICSDCAMAHANGVLPEDDDRAAEVNQFDGILAVDCGEDGEYCVDFSTAWCDACRTHLAGDRHRAWLVA